MVPKLRGITLNGELFCAGRNLWEGQGLKVEQARRLKELERENTLLRRAVADLTLDKLVLKGEAGPRPKAA